ncbi:MAG TPA: phytanoyl-CoA dioxygenase family protein [Bacilli bacterium]
MAKLNDTQLEQYAEQGYIIFENLFTTHEMTELTAHIDKLDEERETELRLIGQQGISIPSQINFTAHLVNQNEFINRFSMEHKFVDITTSILGPDIKLYWDQSVYKRPEANRDFPWHQDTGYALTEPHHYTTCWLALEDATIENGCIWVMPGSHHQGLLMHKETDVGKQCYFGEDPGIPVPLKAGSMVAFNSLLFHRSTPNLSTTTRKGYILQYSIADSYSPLTGQVFDNGPIIAKDGNPVLQADGQFSV